MSEQEQLEQYNEMRRDEARQDEFEMSNLAKLRSLVPQGDGYNSDWANTISDAADELYELKITNIELAARYKALAEWIYSLGMPGVEIYKHELSAAAADALDFILKIDACVDDAHRALIETIAKCKEWDEVACRDTTINHLEERIKTLQEQYANWKDQNEIALDNAEYRIKELEAALNKTAVQRDELRQISRGHSLTCSFIHGATKCDCGFHNMVGRIKP